LRLVAQRERRWTCFDREWQGEEEEEEEEEQMVVVDAGGCHRCLSSWTGRLGKQ
jgi:hypothetical protein